MFFMLLCAMTVGAVHRRGRAWRCCQVQYLGLLPLGVLSDLLDDESGLSRPLCDRSVPGGPGSITQGWARSRATARRGCIYRPPHYRKARVHLSPRLGVFLTGGLFFAGEGEREKLAMGAWIRDAGV